MRTNAAGGGHRTARRPTVLLAAGALMLTGCGTSEGTSVATDGGPAAPYAVEADELKDADGLAEAEELDEDAYDEYGVPDPTGAPSPQPTTGPCPDDGVRITAGVVNPAMGLRALTVHLVNCGDAPYTLHGYPEARALDARREPLDVRVLDGTEHVTAGGVGDQRVRSVTVQPGDSAHTSVVWRNTTEFGEPVDAPYLDVAPAEGAAWQTTVPDGGLDLGTTGELALGPWQPGAPGDTPTTPEPEHG
ncbi:DUF4232 domain-containing protein [Streptomyces chumphonensis]|uniref:DUF4232 domain-containing protein n=1 Tax=Streptomyces chumphonensis TaxID=1214925 RepID=UPI003D7309D8